MRTQIRWVALICCLLISSVLTAQTASDAAAIVSKAQAEAAQQHKVVFVFFGASWCGMCRKLTQYIETPEVHPIIDRYFVVAHLNAMEQAGGHPERNTPGAAELLSKYGGGNDGVPFFAFLDEKGTVIVNSMAPKTGNVGFPVAPEEIDWFMKMVGRAVPSMTAAETATLRDKLETKKAATH